MFLASYKRKKSVHDLRVWGFSACIGLIVLLFADFGYAQVTTYSYDALGRVVVVASDTEDDREYTYDEAGNIDKMTVINNGITGNVPPVCVDGSDAVSKFDSSTIVAVVSLYCTDINPGDILTLVSFTPPTNGAIASISGNNLSLSNLPSGVTSVPYVVSDGNGGSDPAVLTVFRAFGDGGIDF